jgi:hypothetical protein
MEYIGRLEHELSSWPDVSIHPHRFGGREFRFGSAEIGHIHTDGAVDIPYPLSIHDALIAEGHAAQHRWVPNSGWITFHVHDEGDIKHAVWLMRLSYLRYKLKSAIDPLVLLEHESEQLCLSPKTMSLFAQLLPATARPMTEPSTV